ncbi:MAG: hypothetical protein KAT74_03690 [Candidatus Cloacimonetes bacterium]|nr:hypothetical protein [Candidatus Cloacimonadota bacterium]
MKTKHKKLIPLFILGGIGLVFLGGWIVQLLWNATISEIFSVKAITYWQAFMLIILCKILFGSHYNVKKHPRPRFVEHHLFKKEKQPEAEEKDEE